MLGAIALETCGFAEPQKYVIDVLALQFNTLSRYLTSQCTYFIDILRYQLYIIHRRTRIIIVHALWM